MDKKVDLPEAGSEAFLLFEMNAMDALYQHLGDGYLFISLAHLSQGVLPTIRVCLANMLKGGDPDLENLLSKMTLDELATKIGDAIYLSWRGKRLSDLAE